MRSGWSWLVALTCGLGPGCGEDGAPTGGDRGPDVAPPAAIGDLRLAAASDSSLEVQWTAPGDDGGNGTAASYDLRRAEAPISAATWDAAVSIRRFEAPGPAGSAESATIGGLSPGTTYFLAVRSFDEAANRSELSNVLEATTAPPPDPYSSEDYETIGTLLGRLLTSLHPAIVGLAGFSSEVRGSRDLTVSVGEPQTAPGTCPDLAWSGESDPRILSIDYGEGCAGPDGTPHSGGYTVSGSFDPELGWTLEIAFEDFTVEDGAYLLEGRVLLSGRGSSFALDLESDLRGSEEVIQLDLALRAELELDPEDLWSTALEIRGEGDVTIDPGGSYTFAMAEEDPIRWPARCAVPVEGVLTLTIPSEDLDDFDLPRGATPETLTPKIGFAAPQDDAPACDRIVRVEIGPYVRDVEIR